jgi:tetratricopeptide (TPR) repeat protein
MRLGILQNLAIAGGLVIFPVVPADADTAADLKLCVSAGDDYDTDIEDACDRYIQSGEGSVEERVGAYTSRARVIAADDGCDEAVDDMNEVIKLGATAEAYRLRGKYQYQCDEMDKAIEDLNASLDLDGRNAEAFLLRGEAYYGQNEIDKAVADVDRAIKLSPKYAEAYLFKGDIFTEDFVDQSAPEKAIASYSKAIQYGGGAKAYHARAEAYYTAGRMQRAVDDIDEALKTNPNSIDWHELRAESFEAMEKYNEAITEYGVILALRPDSDTTRASRADVFLKKGDLYAAIADYTAALVIKPTKRPLCARGRAYRMLGQYKAALEDLKVSVTVSPFAFDYVELGRSYAGLGDAANAKDSFDKALEFVNKPSSGKYASTYSQRATIYLAMGRHDDALADINTAIGMIKNMPEYYTTRAEIYDAMGNADAASDDRATAADLAADKLAFAREGDSADDAAWGATGKGTIQKMH